MLYFYDTLIESHYPFLTPFIPESDLKMPRNALYRSALLRLIHEFSPYMLTGEFCYVCLRYVWWASGWSRKEYHQCGSCDNWSSNRGEDWEGVYSDFLDDWS